MSTAVVLVFAAQAPPTGRRRNCSCAGSNLLDLGAVSVSVLTILKACFQSDAGAGGQLRYPWGFLTPASAAGPQCSRRYGERTTPVVVPACGRVNLASALCDRPPQVKVGT